MALGTRVQTRPVVFALSFRGKSWAAFGNEEAVSDKTILENRGLSTSYPGSLTRTNSRWRTHLFPFCAYPIKRLVLVLTTRNAPSGGSKTSRARARVSCDVINDFRPATQSVKCERFVLIAATMRRPLSSFSLSEMLLYS